MIKPATRAMQNLVRWLLDREPHAGNSPELKVQAAFRACEKLGNLLSAIARVAGFRSLRMRQMRLCLRLLSLIFFVATPLTSSVHAQSQRHVDLIGKNVLILHAFEANVPIFGLTDRGLRTALDAGGVGIRNQFFEYEHP